MNPLPKALTMFLLSKMLNLTNNKNADKKTHFTLHF